MKRETYNAPELDSVMLSEESGLCVKGSGSNEDYNEHNFNWN